MLDNPHLVIPEMVEKIHASGVFPNIGRCAIEYRVEEGKGYLKVYSPYRAKEISMLSDVIHKIVFGYVEESLCNYGLLYINVVDGLIDMEYEIYRKIA